MLSLRCFIVILAVIAVVKGLALPQPVKGPTRFSNLAESLTINSGLSIQHLPNTEKIVSVWLEEGSDLQQATAKGAILSTTGELNATFTVSASNVLSFYTPAVIIPRTTTSFSVIVASPSSGSLYSIRNFDTAGQLLSGPFPIREGNICIFSNGVLHESTGDIFFVCTYSQLNAQNITEYFINAHRVNATGYILDTATYQTPYESSKPTIAVSGNAVAVSAVVLDLAQSIAVLLVFRADADDLSNYDSFFPYSGASLTLAHHVIADPFIENAFVLVASSAVVSDALYYYIVGIRFDRENTSIAETYVSYSGLAISISVAVSEQGLGVLYLVTATNNVRLVYPLQINENDTVIEVDTAALDTIRVLSADEKAVEAWKDVRAASTTWGTGSAIVWFEVSADTSTFSVVSKIWGTYCGDNFAEGDEECDGGVDCNADCTCPMGVDSDGKNGCGSSNPPSSPSPSSPAQPTRPISAGPVAAPSDKASTAQNIQGCLALTGVFAIAIATAF